MADSTNASSIMLQLLVGMTKHGASDLHLKVGLSPTYRVGGKLRRIDSIPPLPSTQYVHDMLVQLIPPAKAEHYESTGDLDFAYAGSTGDRYRINVFRSGTEMHAAIRRVQSNIPTFTGLHMPPIYETLAQRTFEGLVIISGVTGCGKSSTLAAMIDHINHTRATHIITIEDPVEYRFTPDKSIISQREIGIDIPDYAEALRYVVRQDPDVILIGEMRDRGTMMAALQAAETGHLVFGTLHCSDAQQSFARILEFFPRIEHDFIRSSLANSLRAICVQRLLPGIETDSRVPATEILLNNAVVKDKIRRSEDKDMPSIIARSTEEGMRTFTFSLAQLIEQEMVHYDTAMDYAPNRDALTSLVKGIQTSE